MKSLLFLLILVSSLAARPAELTQIDQKIIFHTFNEEFDQAIKLSQAQIKLNPDSPKYYYYYINTKILDYYQKLSEADGDKRSELRKVLNKELIDYCESAVGKFDDSKLNPENKFYYGTMYAYLARVYGMDGSWWGAFKAGLKAKHLMEDIIKSDPQFYDAYLVLGMLNYYADRLGGIAGFAAGILGFSGDRVLGLSYLQIAYEKGKLTYGQTALTLIEVYANLEDNEYKAIGYYESFLKHFPRNKRMTNAYIQELINISNLYTAGAVINNDSLGIVDDYTKARFYDVKGNPEMAIRFAVNALADESKLWRGAGNNARYILVKNAWLVGNNQLVQKYESSLTDRYKENFDFMKSNEKSSRWLYRFAVLAASGTSQNEIEKAAASKPQFPAASGMEDQYNILSGDYYFRKNLFDTAETYFDKCLQSDNDRDKYTAVKFITDIYMKKTVPVNKVKKLLDVIDDIDNDRLAFRAKDLEKKYNL